MAFPKIVAAAEPHEDRLSDLPDGVLGHVLSFLSADEAVTQLELKGALASSSAISAVARILEQTPNLEILTLLMLPDVDEFPRYQAAVICDPEVGLDVPDVLPVIPCLRDRVREINVVHYQGRVAQRTLLKLLLRIGSALEELYVVFPEGKYAVQSMLMGEIESWVMVMDRPVKVMFA